MSKVFYEPRHVGEFILSEANGQRSREAVKIAPNQVIEPGTVLALLTQSGGVSTSTVAASGNTGNGTLVLADPAVSAKVQRGTYSVTATTATSFSVAGPDGSAIGIATAGTAFNKEIKFTITAGTTAFVAGDAFEITADFAEPGDFLAVAYNPDGTDGSDKAGAIAIYPAVTGDGETANIAAIFRDAEVNTNLLAWPDGLAPEKKLSVIDDLEDRGIIVR